MAQGRTQADSPPRDIAKAPGNKPFLRQRVGAAGPKRRYSEGASTGRSAKSTAGGATGQLTAKD
ncbi:hypothetical protein [Variovorax sp. DT-64]|uniref:hypothetical protein n=1 Tax=Variovorax sp. DT-64 TaxID=3396160 RepID=UPI003F1D2900